MYLNIPLESYRDLTIYYSPSSRNVLDKS